MNIAADHIKECVFKMKKKKIVAEGLFTFNLNKCCKNGQVFKFTHLILFQKRENRIISRMMQNINITLHIIHLYSVRHDFLLLFDSHVLSAINF